MELALMATKKSEINRRGRRGLTLIEVLVAIVIFTLFALGLLPLATGATLLRKQQQLIAEATDLAQIQLEETRRYWAPYIGATTTPAVNYTPGLLPVFGETLANCNLKVTTLQPKVLAGTLLSDPESVAANAGGIVNYAIRENLVTDRTDTSTASCVYRDSDATTNKSKQVRYIAQLFWGDLTTEAPPNSARRVVVRIYRATGAGATCSGTGCVPVCVTTPANCLPPGATLRPALPVFTGNGSAVDGRAPLVVLTADISEPKA
jgi:prepilin-type N-terminal cleavage/methylation domain-containing protein